MIFFVGSFYFPCSGGVHHKIFFPPAVFLIASGHEAFQLASSFFTLSDFFFCCWFVSFSDFIYEQDRPFPRQDPALWPTPAALPASVYR